MNWLVVIGDAFWIVSLALIASTALQARGRLAPADRLPLFWGLGRLGLTARRDPVLIAALAAPFLVSAATSWMARAPDLQDSGLLVCLARIFTAGAAAGLHVAWLRGVLDPT